MEFINGALRHRWKRALLPDSSVQSHVSWREGDCASRVRQEGPTDEVQEASKYDKDRLFQGLLWPVARDDQDD